MSEMFPEPVIEPDDVEEVEADSTDPQSADQGHPDFDKDGIQ